MWTSSQNWGDIGESCHRKTGSRAASEWSHLSDKRTPTAEDMMKNLTRGLQVLAWVLAALPHLHTMGEVIPQKRIREHSPGKGVRELSRSMAPGHWSGGWYLWKDFSFPDNKFSSAIKHCKILNIVCTLILKPHLLLFFNTSGKSNFHFSKLNQKRKKKKRKKKKKKPNPKSLH